jgi:hypothetical protein
VRSRRGESLCNTCEVAPDRPKRVPLERVPSLDSAQVDILKQAYVTSAEALVGQLEADPEGIGALLHLAPGELKQLTTDAKAVLPLETRKEFTKQIGKRYSYGALNPNRD